MKSGRHFRFIANFHAQTAWNLGNTLIWSHSESCHGKDLSDPECGRAKFILRCHEMRHTNEVPTMLKTSREQFDHLDKCHRLTRRSLREKKGKGIYYRVYHWMPAKSIRPLSSLAEINTLDGGLTLKSHFFINCGQVGMIKVREIACLSCDECRVYRYTRCKQTRFCGPLLCREVKQKSGSRDNAIETRHCSAIQDAGRVRAAQVLPGMMVGSECESDAEPYIVSLALTAEQTWEGEPGSSWMGTITAGNVHSD
jgi:hypothetical protein